MFREELKVGRRKQKLPAKQTILEALRKPVEPNNWWVPFFLSIVFYRVFFLFIELVFVFFFFFFYCLMTGFVIKNYIDLLFLPSHVGTRA